MRTARHSTGYLRRFYIHGLTQHHLFTSSDVLDELWAAVCYFSEVPDAGKELLLARGVPAAQADDAYVSLQSFLRQARAFYSAARTSSWRSSPLIYYYSFLNLAKALICLKWPDRVRNRIGHGLTHQLSDVALETQTISVAGDGVFPLLYELLLGQQVAGGTTFDVLSLLSYCSDVANEVVSVKKSKVRTLRGKSRLYINAGEAYAVVAIHMFEWFEDCASAKERFFKTFEEVSLPKPRVRAEFGLLAEDASQWRFFETIKSEKCDPQNIPVPKLYAVCEEALKPFMLEYPYRDDEVDFLICPPVMCPDPLFFNEILGAYATLFFLSSLVRYYPRYFEQALVSKDVWMIDVFIRSVPSTLLRFLANRLFGENRQIGGR